MRTSGIVPMLPWILALFGYLLVSTFAKSRKQTYLHIAFLMGGIATPKAMRTPPPSVGPARNRLRDHILTRPFSCLGDASETMLRPLSSAPGSNSITLAGETRDMTLANSSRIVGNAV